MIIVEGPDNSGKTTLARKLAQLLELLYMNNRRLPKQVKDVSKYLERCLLMDQHFPVILDRLSLISEPIYGPICRQVNLLDLPTQDQLLRHLHPHKPLIIYCRPPRDEILADNGREQMDGVVAYGPKLLEVYDQTMDRLQVSFKVFRYDWTQDDIGELARKINNQLELT